jgi:serine/threonine-protein kinase ATR
MRPIVACLAIPPDSFLVFLGRSKGTVADVLEILLSRCVHETAPTVRMLLASCLGEIGAIDDNRLEELTDHPSLGGNDDSGSELSTPPWNAHPVRYELHLVTNQLVMALKTATTSTEQHKIGFAIQELLLLLDANGKETQPGQQSIADGIPDQSCTDKHREMSTWLSGKLSSAGVLDLVEPFWNSQFREADKGGLKLKQPPFFRKSPNYVVWISHFCRYLVQRSFETKRSEWSEMFYGCRMAIRSEAGLVVAEVLLPILVLDRLCFGNTQDERLIFSEFIDTLSFGEDNVNTLMDQTERQKAVDAVFKVVETLERWAQEEAELKHKGRSRSSSASKKPDPDAAAIGGWEADESVMRIEDLLQAVPLSFRAHAAEKVSMHARSLRLLEMATRKSVTMVVYDAANADASTIDDIPCRETRSRAAGNCAQEDINLMKDVLASLDDYETLSSLVGDQYQVDPKSSVRDGVRQKQASGDWEGALQDYERAQQLSCTDNFALQRGALRCSLELGHFESVLNQVNGIIRSAQSLADEKNHASRRVVPLGIEAAWRLGRWETLSNLLSESDATDNDPETVYQVSLGHLMLDIKNKDENGISVHLRRAQGALMDGLSSFARESFSRSYDHIVKLQCLREVEDAVPMLCSQANHELKHLSMSLGWDRRLDFVSPNGSSEVIKTRLTLCRLASDTALEGSLFLNLGRRARKRDLRNIATNSFARAETAFLESLALDNSQILGRSSLQLEVAKLKHDCGESGAALRLLELENVEELTNLDISKLREEAVKHVCKMLQISQSAVPEQKAVDVFCRRLLQSTRWMVDGGLKAGAEVFKRFEIINALTPKWSKGK